MKKRKKQKSRLILLSVMLFGTTIMLASSTFAWFTANRTVTVDSIQVNVAASGGIQISADGQNWKSMVDQAELLAASTIYPAARNQIPGQLAAISSGLGVNAEGRMIMYSGSVSANGTGQYILATAPSEEAHGSVGSFIAFDLFIRLDSAAPGTIYLTPNSGVVGYGTDKGIQNASRVAFVNLGNVSIGTGLSGIQAINAGVGAPVRLWEPNFERHTAPAITHAFDTYGLTITDPHATAVSYDGVVGTVTTADNVLVGAANHSHGTQGSKFTTITPTFTTAQGFTTYPTAFTLTPGTITKMRLYMWMEGQDVDCENAASGSTAIFNVQFSLDNA